MVYNYTKPRGPIAAMYTSPGPCYGLPSLVGVETHDPRSVHNRYPAYSFGVRHGQFNLDCSPGPCYLPDSKIDKHGKDGTPIYSLYSRQRDLPPFKTPGPGAYSPENTIPISKFRYPAYSFGARNRHRAQDNTPAANSYSLPGMIGKTVQSAKVQAPCISLAGRQTTGGFAEDLAKAPGPGTYTMTNPSTYKNRSPQYSMTGRNMMPGDPTQKPGPGQHRPENVWLHKHAQPDYSFGIRHTQYLTPLIVEVKE